MGLQINPSQINGFKNSMDIGQGGYHYKIAYDSGCSDMIPEIH